MSGRIPRKPRLVFRVALRHAIRMSHEAGEISDAEAKLMSEFIRNPNRLDRQGKPVNLMEIAEHTCKSKLRDAEGDEALAVGDIDWGHWLDLLKTWLPIIIQILIAVVPLFLDNGPNGRSQKQTGNNDSTSNSL
jgi:hypothetical protein